MTSQSIDIFSMLNKAQTEYNNNNNKQQQHSQSVANFFRQASHPVQSTVPIQIQNVNSLESIEKHIRASPPNQNNANNYQKNESVNSPLANFFNSNNINAGPMTKEVKSHENGKLLNKSHHVKNGQIQAPPGFKQPQSLQTLLNKPNINNMNNKETKLIPPTMFKTSNIINNNNINNNDKKPSPTMSSKPSEPLTKNQMMQALNFLIENDDEFNNKLHDAYIKSFNNMTL